MVCTVHMCIANTVFHYVHYKNNLLRAVSFDDFPEYYYGKYCAGAAYILTSDLVPQLNEAAGRTEFLWVDDYFVTGILTSAIKKQPRWINIQSLFYFPVTADTVAEFHNQTQPIFVVNVQETRKIFKLWNVILSRWEKVNGHLPGLILQYV